MQRPRTKPPVGRTAILYVSFFLAVAGPTIALLLAGFLGPEPYVIVRDELGPYTDTARSRQEADVETKTFADAAEAREASKRYADGVAKRSAVKTLRTHRYVREDNGRYELVMPIDNVLLRLSGRDREHVDAVFEDLPFVAENPKENWVWSLTTNHLRELVIGIVLYAALLAVIFSRAASRAARVEPRDGVEPLSSARLSERLLALTSLEIPFHVTEAKDGRLVAEWRLADHQWSSVLQKGGLRHAHTLHIDLDESQGIARVIQTTRQASWSHGPLSFMANLNWSRSISFYHSSTEAGYGLVPTEDGWKLNETYSYRYNIGEIVQPVARLIVESGWEFRPVYTFFRPLGG